MTESQFQTLSGWDKFCYFIGLVVVVISTISGLILVAIGLGNTVGLIK